MDIYLLIKTLHIISSTVLFGTGMGIAFFMYQSKNTSHLETRYFLAQNTVLADYLFTLPSVIIQPATGFWLLHYSTYQWHDKWLLLTYIIFIVAGLCWLPVVWIQIQLKHILQECIMQHQALPQRYHRLFTLWFLLGWPAFTGLISIFLLMVFKPI